MNWVYKHGEEPQMVSDADYQSYLTNGWFDSPAKIAVFFEPVEVKPVEVATIEPVAVSEPKKAKEKVKKVAENLEVK